MSTIIDQLSGAFRSAIRAAFDIDADPIITPSQTEKFGDYQSNAAMGLAKGLKSNPRAVAQQIVARLTLGAMVDEPPSIAGPGFINVRLSRTWLAEQLGRVERDECGGLVAGGLKVVVDYSGPNVAKELHVGHIRSTIIGDALARVLEARGDQVIRQNHLGDWGTQFGMLLAHLRETPAGTSAEAHIADLEDFYRQSKKRFDEDAAFAETARQTVVKLQGGEGEARELWKRIIDETRRHFQPLYERLNVTLRPEHERGESFYNPFLADVVKELREKGVAVESEGAIVIFVEGFEAPLIIQKRDGGFGYGTTDLAAIRYRVRELGAKRLIYVTDSRQIQHFKQVFWAARKAGWAEGVELEHVTFGSILGPDNKPFKTRGGDTVKLKDLLDEAEERSFALVTQKNSELPEDLRRAIARAVGVGAIKYYDLSRDRINDYVFDWDKMLSLDGNTAPYLQYAHARIKSIFRKAESSGFGVQGSGIRLEHPAELALAKHMLRLAEVLEVVNRELRPHHLCTYLYELSTRFSAFYENCPVIQSEEPTRSSRLAICRLAARTLALGLDLLGIEHPEQM